MVVRSINLKMVLPRGEDGKRLRRSLWLTHSVVNQAVVEIENRLLLCRGQSYSTESGAVPAEDVAKAALAMARQVQSASGKVVVGSDEEVLAALRQLYEAIVPSVVLDEEGRPQRGSAQAAGGFASPMMDATSEGFLSVFEKILEPPPAWTAKMQEPDAAWEAESIEWLKSDDALRLQHAAGSPPAWVRRLRASEPWQQAFLEAYVAGSTARSTVSTGKNEAPSPPSCWNISVLSRRIE